MTRIGDTARRRWPQIALLCLTVGFIWTHSLMPAVVSGEESGVLAAMAARLLHALGIQGVTAETLDHPIRKLAHFTEFAALGLQLGLLPERRDRRASLSAWLCGFFTAFIDETLQLFTPGRSGEIRDVWLDASGVLAGVLLALLLTRALQIAGKRT